MKRETRANFLFLVLFIAISLPGAIILVRKKMVPGAHSMATPDAVLNRLPYMTPLDTPPQIARIVPRLTGEWVAKLTHDRAEGAAVFTEEGERGPRPVMSTDHLLQLAACHWSPDSIDVHLMLWDPNIQSDMARPGALTLSATTSQGTVVGQVVEAQSVAVPAEVQRELADAGLIQPPRLVLWVAGKIAMKDRIEPNARLDIHLTESAAGQKHTLSVVSN